ncbi:MAG: prolyl oligopeptidase family serine peptidase [Actinomycetota bacterium]
MSVETRPTDTPIWERRFRAPTVWLPTWSPDAPERLVYASNQGGSWQLWAWDRSTGERNKVTDDPVGLHDGFPTPDGSGIVWFHDDTGDEFGRYLVAPFEGGGTEPLVEGIPDGWPAGHAVREGVVAVALGEREGFAIYVSVDGERAREVYRHDEVLGLGGGEHTGFNTGGLSADGSLLAFAHSEHGDPLHPALRVLDVRTGETVGDLWDGDGKGLSAAAWSPVPGDQRLAVVHERADLQRPTIWNPVTGERSDLEVDHPGAIEEIWDWYPDGSAILVSASLDGRDSLLRIDASTGAATPVEHDEGVVSVARVRPDGEVWIRCSAGGTPSRVIGARGTSLLELDGEASPGGRPYESWEFTNPNGQRVHGFVVRPDGEGPFPLVIDIHGGPTWQWYDEFSPTVQSWVDAGFAVALVNYRGSTGYGAAWRDEINGNPGFTELEDVMAGLDDLIASGIADPARAVIAGDSWGGYLTLLGIGMHPDRWAAAAAGVPVADYVAAFEDEAPSLQAMDRGLFGAGPDEKREMYEERSPITFVDRVETPLLILAGENDSRCPIRQVDNYVAAMRERGKELEVYRYDTGHSSFVVDERVHQQRIRLEFAAKHVPGVTPS